MVPQSMKSRQTQKVGFLVGLLLCTLMLAWFGHDLLGKGYHDILGQASYDTGGWIDVGPVSHAVAVPEVGFELQAPQFEGYVVYRASGSATLPSLTPIFRKHVPRPPPAALWASFRT